MDVSDLPFLDGAKSEGGNRAAVPFTAAELSC